ncbi:MAG TPA: hypothetical protein VJ772_02400 [Nitrososphaeraceae archaeon]|nr:hypothetical protein [Nitrososphaeraceae archaeon]
MSINPSDPHVRYTQIIDYSKTPKPKQSDDLFLREGVNGWRLSYNTNEYGKVIVKATKIIESTEYNDESKIEFTIETKEKRIPTIKKINIGYKSHFADPDFLEIDDNKDRTTQSFEGHYSGQYVASSILTPIEFVQEVIPDVDKLLNDRKFNEYVSGFEESAK